MYLLITLLSIIWLLDIVVLLKEQRVSVRFHLYEFGIKESNALKGILALGIILSHLQTFCFRPYPQTIVDIEWDVIDLRKKVWIEKSLKFLYDALK